MSGEVFEPWDILQFITRDLIGNCDFCLTSSHRRINLVNRGITVLSSLDAHTDLSTHMRTYQSQLQRTDFNHQIWKISLNHLDSNCKTLQLH